MSSLDQQGSSLMNSNYSVNRLGGGSSSFIQCTNDSISTNIHHQHHPLFNTHHNGNAMFENNNHNQQQQQYFETSNLLKDWRVTISGYSSQIPGSLEEYGSLKQLVSANGGRVEGALLLTCTHLLSKKGSTSKCVAAWEHNKKIKMNATHHQNNHTSGAKEILVVTPEFVPAYLHHLREYNQQQLLLLQNTQNDQQQQTTTTTTSSPINNNNNNNAQEPEAKDPTANNHEQEEEDSQLLRTLQMEKHQQQQQEKGIIPPFSFDPSPYLVKPLTGYIISYTGFPPGDSRTELEEKIRNLGGEISRYMTRQVNYLIIPSGVEIPYDLGGASSQHQSQQQQQQHYGGGGGGMMMTTMQANLNLEKLRLADALDVPMVYSSTFLNVLATRERTIDTISEKLAKVKKAKPMSMSQSLAQTTETIMGSTNISTILGNSSNSNNQDYSFMNGTNNNLLTLSQQQQQQQNPEDHQNRNSSNSTTARSSVSPYGSQQQQNNNNSNPSSQQQQQQENFHNPPPPPPPDPFTITPSLLKKFSSWTQDAVVCVLFATDDQVRNLSWLMNTISVPVITVPNPNIINETIFLVGTELESAYHDTVRKYFELHYGISDFVRRTAYSLHLWLNSVAELMMMLEFKTKEVANAVREIDLNIQVAREKLLLQQQEEEIQRHNSSASSGLGDAAPPNTTSSPEQQQQESEENLTTKSRDWVAVIEELESQKQLQYQDLELIESRVTIMFDGETPARSLDNHPELFQNHIMSYFGWVEDMKKQEEEEEQQQRHSGTNYYYQYSSSSSQQNNNNNNNNMLYSNHHHYSDEAEGDPNSSSQNFDISKMVSRILSRSHYNNNNNNNNSQSQQQTQQNFSAYYKTVQQGGSNNDENSNNSATSNSNNNNNQRKKTINGNNNNNNKIIQVSRNPATNSIFSSIYFVIDGAMTEECVQITKHAIHLGGGVYDRSSTTSSQQQALLLSSRSNKYFVISHARQRLWGDPSIKTEEERRRQGFVNDVTVDWLLHCVKLGAFIDPKSSFVFNTPVNKLQQHQLPAPVTSDHHHSRKSTSSKKLLHHNNNNSKFPLLASPFVLEPRKFLKKQISHAGVVALIPKCGDDASVCDLMSSVVTLLGGHTLKVHQENGENIETTISPHDATKKLTHIIFPTGNWMNFKPPSNNQLNNGSFSPSKFRTSSAATFSPTNNNNNNKNNIENQAGTIRQRDDDHQHHSSTNHNHHSIEFYDSIVQRNVEWLATAISLLPSLGIDYKSKFVNDPNTNNPVKPNPNLLFIVSQEWLEKSAKLGYFVDETEFVVEMNPFIPTMLPSKLGPAMASSPMKHLITVPNQQQQNNNNNNNTNKMMAMMSPTSTSKKKQVAASSSQICNSITASQVQSKLDKSAALIMNTNFDDDDDDSQKRNLQLPSQLLPTTKDQLLEHEQQPEHPSQPVAKLNLNRFIVGVENNNTNDDQSQQQYHDGNDDDVPLPVEKTPIAGPAHQSTNINNNINNSGTAARSSFFDVEEEDEEGGEDGDDENNNKDTTNLAAQRMLEIEKEIMRDFGDGVDENDDNQQQQETQNTNNNHESNNENVEDIPPPASQHWFKTT